MKVKYLVCASGDRFVRNIGDTVDLPDSEAKRLIEHGHVMPVDDDKKGDKKTGKKDK